VVLLSFFVASLDTLLLRHHPLPIQQLLGKETKTKPGEKTGGERGGVSARELVGGDGVGDGCDISTICLQECDLGILDAVMIGKLFEVNTR
jgi:hypothetical protein